MISSKFDLLEAVSSKDNKFVDRANVQKEFWNQYNDLNNHLETFKVLSIYGIGGIGKTSLLTFLCHELKSKNILYIKYDLNNGGYDKRSMLYKLSASIRSKYKDSFCFPIFYAALIMIANYNGETISLDKDIKNIIQENSWLSILLEDISLIPIIGTVAQVIKAADITTTAMRNYFKEKKAIDEYNEIITKMNYLEANELLDRLHIYFAIDMINNMSTLNRPLVIMLDTYEQFVDIFNKAGSSIIDDHWLRKGSSSLIRSIPGILWVIAGREKLLWDIDDEWDNNSLKQLNMERLNDEYAGKYLQLNGITDNDLIANLCSLTMGIPIFLDICIEQFHLLKTKKSNISIEDFGNQRDVLVERYTRYLDSVYLDMIQLLSCLKQWSDHLVLYVGSNSKTIRSFSLNRYRIFLNNSMVTPIEGNQYKLHDVVQSAIIKSVEPEVICEIQNLAVRYYINKIDTADSIIELKDMLLKVVDYLGEYADINIIIRRYTWFRNCIKKITDSGDYTISIALQNLINSINENTENDLFTAYIKTQIACVEYQGGKYTSSHENSAQAVAILNNIGININSDVFLDAKIVLGNSLVQIGEYEKAISLFDEIINQSKLNEDNFYYWEILRGLAYAHLVLENYSKALELAKKIYDHDSLLLGEDAYKTIESMSFLGWSCIENSNYDEAIIYTKHSLNKNLKKHGKYHPQTGSNYNNLGYAYLRKGDYPNALHYLNIAKEIRELIYSNTHSAVARTINNIGRTYYAIGDWKKASVYFNTAYTIRKTAYDYDHPEIANSLYYLALIKMKEKNYPEAIRLLEKCLQIRRVKLLPWAKDIIATYEALMDACLGNGNIKQYSAYFKVYASITQKKTSYR